MAYITVYYYTAHTLCIFVKLSIVPLCQKTNCAVVPKFGDFIVPKNKGGRPKKYGEQLHRVSLRVPNELYIRILKHAQQTQKNASETIIEALDKSIP